MDIDTIRDNLSSIAAQAVRHNRPLPFVFEIDISPVDILSWTARRPDSAKVYWADRDGEMEIGGVGNAFTLTGDADNPATAQAARIIEIPGGDRLLFFHGRRFSAEPDKGNLWRDFPTDISFIPDRMIIRRGDKYALGIGLPVKPDDDLQERVAQIENALSETTAMPGCPESVELPAPVSSRLNPEYHQWRKNVEIIISAIDSGRLDKVVLARKSDYRFEVDIDPFMLLSVLREQNRRCYALLYQPKPGAAFVSLSPERLYRRRGRTLELDALSSTTARGETGREDRQLEDELLNSGKERLEHRLVIEGVADAASDLCRKKPAVGDTAILKLDRVQHLWTPVSGRLTEGVDDDHILARLHPTPAVGGTPRDEALNMIEEIEDFERGFYAAPFGYLSGPQVEFTVGIRSLVVGGKTVSVFTGAGIVSGSDPEAEWHELESKDILRPLLAGSIRT